MSVERRPSFATEFPPSPELDALVEAFARGDYARVRAEAPALAKTSGDQAVQAAARTLLERTRPDPLAVRLVLFAAALLVVLAGWWIVHAKPPAGASPTTTPVERVMH